MGFLGILLLYNESAKSIYNDFQVIKGDICAKNLAQLTGLGCAAVGFQFAKSCSHAGFGTYGSPHRWSLISSDPSIDASTHPSVAKCALLVLSETAVVDEQVLEPPPSVIDNVGPSGGVNMWSLQRVITSIDDGSFYNSWLNSSAPIFPKVFPKRIPDLQWVNKRMTRRQ